MQVVPSARGLELGCLRFGMLHYLANLISHLCLISDLPKQNRADSGTTKIKFNPTKVRELMVHPGLYNLHDKMKVRVLSGSSLDVDHLEDGLLIEAGARGEELAAVLVPLDAAHVQLEAVMLVVAAER